MQTLIVYILPEHVYSKIDEAAIQSYNNEPVDGKPTVGAGPYRGHRAQGRRVHRLSANPNFYRGKPAVDEVVFKLYANPDALGQALKKGEIDYADCLEANVFDSLADAPNIERRSALYPGFNELAFNTGAALDTGKPIGDGNPLLKDKRLREAIGWSLDRKTMVDKVFGGHGSVGTTIIAPDVRQLAPLAAQRGQLRPGEGQVAAGRRGLSRRSGRHPARRERRTGSISVSSADRTRRRRRRPSSTSSATSPTSVSRRTSRSSRRTPSPRRSARASSTCSNGDG